MMERFMNVDRECCSVLFYRIISYFSRLHQVVSHPACEGLGFRFRFRRTEVLRCAWFCSFYTKNAYGVLKIRIHIFCVISLDENVWW